MSRKVAIIQSKLWVNPRLHRPTTLTETARTSNVQKMNPFIYVQLMAGDSFDASEVLTGPGEFPNFLTRGDTFDITLSPSGPADINSSAQQLPPAARNHCVHS